MSFSGFCDLLGLSKVRDYLISRQVHAIEEWGLYQLDTEGQMIQKDLEARLKVAVLLSHYNSNILTTPRLFHYEPQSHFWLVRLKK